MMVGLLPAYGRSPNNAVFAMGGMTSQWDAKSRLSWHDINSDAMRPFITKEASKSNPNLPHVDGRYAKFADHVEDFIAGFADYAAFLCRQNADHGKLFDDFVGLPVRKVIRPTRFYHMLLQRLKSQRTMDDGITWSAQADFLARLANWQIDDDPLWRFQRHERDALLTLNVPHFLIADDGTKRGRASDTIQNPDWMLHAHVSTASTRKKLPGRSKLFGRTPAQRASPPRRSSLERRTAPLRA